MKERSRAPASNPEAQAAASGLAGDLQRNMDELNTVYSQLAIGDVSRLLELCDPKVEIIEPPEIPDASVFHGREGVRGVLAKLEEVFPDLQFAPDEFKGQGDRVLVSVQWLGTGAGSGARGRVALFHVWTFKANRATRIEAFLDRAKALEAAGLQE